MAAACRRHLNRLGQTLPKSLRRFKPFLAVFLLDGLGQLQTGAAHRRGGCWLRTARLHSHQTARAGHADESTPPTEALHPNHAPDPANNPPQLGWKNRGHSGFFSREQIRRRLIRAMPLPRPTRRMEGSGPWEASPVAPALPNHRLALNDAEHGGSGINQLAGAKPQAAFIYSGYSGVLR